MEQPRSYGVQTSVLVRPPVDVATPRNSHACSCRGLPIVHTLVESSARVARTGDGRIDQWASTLPFRMGIHCCLTDSASKRFFYQKLFLIIISLFASNAITYQNSLADFITAITWCSHHGELCWDFAIVALYREGLMIFESFHFYWLESCFFIL